MQRELFISWTGLIIGTAITDINVIMSIMAYGTTISYTTYKIYQEHKKNNKK